MYDGASLTVSSERLDNTVVVRVAGEIDMTTVGRLYSALAEAAPGVAAPNPLVADLIEVTFSVRWGSPRYWLPISAAAIAESPWSSSRLIRGYYGLCASLPWTKFSPSWNP